ncbi:MAG TPA: hypothetical protein VM008_02540 [Phycisphaerae bacterium]|nr:hypothetical protein [Phycisphaerae bacterium]
MYFGQIESLFYYLFGASKLVSHRLNFYMSWIVKIIHDDIDPVRSQIADSYNADEVQPTRFASNDDLWCSKLCSK